MRQFDLEIAGDSSSWPRRSCTSRAANCCPWTSSAGGRREEGEDPRGIDPSARRITKKFKDAAARLQASEAEQENIFCACPAT